MKVAIIGANGFIGRHLTAFLSKNKSVELFLFGRSKSNNGSMLPNYKVIDLKQGETWKEDLRGMDIVYYLASSSIPATTWHEPLNEVHDNLIPFLNFMEFMSTTACKKVVFVSSAGTVYGPSNVKLQEDSNKNPFSPYGIVKLTMEHFLNYYQAKYNIQYDVYRISNVYGEGQDIKKGLGVINIFLDNILKNGAAAVFGNGSNTRNYIYVGDVVRLMALSIDYPEKSGIYNLASNDTLSINELIDLMKSTIDKPFEVEYRDGRQSDNSFIDLDNKKILDLANSFRFTDIEEGILKTYNSLKTQ